MRQGIRFINQAQSHPALVLAPALPSLPSQLLLPPSQLPLSERTLVSLPLSYTNLNSLLFIATSAGISLFTSIKGQIFPWFNEAYRCSSVKRYLFSLIKKVHHSPTVTMLVLERYCNRVLKIKLPMIMLLAIKVSPSSSPEWLRLDSIILAILGCIYCHRESLSAG